MQNEAKQALRFADWRILVISACGILVWTSRTASARCASQVDSPLTMGESDELQQAGLKPVFLLHELLARDSLLWGLGHLERPDKT